jgi:hypothetical protein
VLSGDDDPQINASTAKLHAPDGDDAEGEGVSLVEPIAPAPIGSNASVQTDHSATNRATFGAPSAGGHKWKRPPTVPKRKQVKTLADQVMTQIDLPPYHGPQSPLDLVAIEIIFGRLFEAFRRTSQAAGTGSSAGGNTQPPKKKCALMLKSILTPR